MRNTPKIKSLYLQRLTLALYVSFHQAILACLNTIAYLAKFCIPEELKEQYEKLVEELTDRNNQQRARVGTEEQADEDSERDRLLSFLFSAIKNGLRSKKAEILNAAKQLEIVIRNYQNIQRQAYAAETASIRGLIKDLNKEENTEAVSALALRTIIDQLETANETFSTKWDSAVEETTAKSLQISTAELRRQTDDVFEEICERIYASGFYAEDDDTITLITNKINKINGIIDSYKATYNRSVGQKEANKKEETEESGETEETAES